MNRDLDGIYFRVKRGEKWQNICFSDLTDEEMDTVLEGRDTERYEGAIGICRCEKCGGAFEEFGQTYCCWCGRKIVGCKSNE